MAPTVWYTAIIATSLCTFLELLKKVGEEGLAVGGDVSGIHYPPLPASDNGDLDENKNPTVPPDFDTIRGGTNIPPTLRRR